MKRVLDIEFSMLQPDYGLAIDWNGWVYETTDRGRSWTKISEVGRSYEEAGGEPDDPDWQINGWYAEQLGTRSSELAVDPSDDRIWYIGAGDFWNVKANRRSVAQPTGVALAYADYGYVLKSIDRGRSWTKFTSGLPSELDVARIIVNPSDGRRLIMAANCGVFASDDGGVTWHSSAAGLPNNLPRDLTSYYDGKSGKFELFLVEQTTYQPAGESVRFAGGVFKSTDGGASWVEITGDLPIDLTRIDSEATINRYYRAVAYWLNIPEQQCRTKSPELPGRMLPVFNRIAVSPLNADEIYLSYNKKHDFTFGPGDVWRTVDGGKHWTTCARHGNYWRAGQDDDYWRERGNPVGTNVEFAHLQPYMDRKEEISGNRLLTVNAAGEVFIGIDQQTLKSEDHGQSWKQIDDFETAPGGSSWVGRGGSNLPGRFMLLETGIPNRRLLCSGEHGLWQTTSLDGWHDPRAVPLEQIEGQLYEDGAVSIATVAVHPGDPQTIYILSWRQEQRGKLRRTTNGGQSWENIASIFEAETPSWEGVARQNSLLIDPNDPDFMCFCATKRRIAEIYPGTGPKLTKGGYGFYRSFDGGYTWQLSNNGIHRGASVRRLAMHPDDPRVIYAALNDPEGGLYRTDDRGSHWTRVELPESIKSVNHVFMDRNTKHLLISTGQPAGSYDEGGVWRSKDGGVSWRRIFSAPYVWQAEISPVDPNLIVVSVPNQQTRVEQPFANPGVYLSSNAGQTWSKINRGLGQPDKIVDVHPDPFKRNVLWCASWGAGWFVAYLDDETRTWMVE